MKRRVIKSIGLLVIIFYITGCGLINQGADPGLENGPRAYDADDHQQGEGFGFWNQQRDRNNPIANMITRDQRPGRGMNGIVDRRPTIMNRRISRFDTRIDDERMAPNLEGYSNLNKSQEEQNITEQISLELLKKETVRDTRIIAYKNELLIAVESEAKDTRALKAEISSYLKNNFPNIQVTVVTDRETVAQIFIFDDGFRSGRPSDDYEIQLSQFMNQLNNGSEGTYRE